MSSTWRWDDASRVTGHDPRFKVLRSIAERKLAFNQFIDEQKSKERNEARLRRQQVIINLFDIFNSNERVSKTCLKSNGRTSLA